MNGFQTLRGLADRPWSGFLVSRRRRGRYSEDARTLRVTATPDTLLTQADARWAEIAAAQPDLQPAIDLQRVLVTRMIEALRAVESREPAGVTISPSYVATKLARGVPALRGEPVSLPLVPLGGLLREYCDDLAKGGAGAAAEHIREALDQGRINQESWLAASLARNQRAIRSAGGHFNLSADLLWLVGELALGPFAYALQRAIVGEADDHALASWDRGYCPVCGSWPALAEVCGGARCLRCSFCAASWELGSSRCVYCGEAGERFVTAAPDLDRPGRRLELCESCQGYLKAIDFPAPTPFPLLALEDLATMDLDRAAIERGFGRPPLPEIAVEVERTIPLGCRERQDD